MNTETLTKTGPSLQTPSASITTPATRQPIHPHTHQRTHQTTDLYIQVHASNEHSKQKRVPKHETMPVQNWNPTSGSVSVPVQPASDDRLRQTANFWRRHFSTESMSGVESFRALTPAVWVRDDDDLAEWFKESSEVMLDLDRRDIVVRLQNFLLAGRGRSEFPLRPNNLFITTHVRTVRKLDQPEQGLQLQRTKGLERTLVLTGQCNHACAHLQWKHFFQATQKYLKNNYTDKSLQ